MAFVEGQSLADWLVRGPVDNGLAAGVVRAIAEAVHYAHQRGVVHRDLKPGNVLIDKGGAVKVTDFGLARRLTLGPAPDGTSEAEDEAQRPLPVAAQHMQRLTVTGAVLGTPSYMAPEQVTDAKHAGPAADLFSLGGILYALLTGRPPFLGPDVMETLTQVVADDPVAPRVLNPAVDRDLETICLRCLQKDPAQRYASAAELADDLGRWQAGQPIRARRAGLLKRGLTWTHAQPAILPVLAGLITQQLAGLPEGLFVGGAMAALRFPVRLRSLGQVAIAALLGSLVTALALFYPIWPFGWPVGSGWEYAASLMSGAVFAAVLALGYQAIGCAPQRWQALLARWYRGALPGVVLGLLLVPALTRFAREPFARQGVLEVIEKPGIMLFLLVFFGVVATLVVAIVVHRLFSMRSWLMPRLAAGGVLLTAAALCTAGVYFKDELLLPWRSVDFPTRQLLDFLGTCLVCGISWLVAALLGIGSGVLLGSIRRGIGTLKLPNHEGAMAAFVWGAAAVALLTQVGLLLLSQQVGERRIGQMLQLGPAPASLVAAAVVYRVFGSMNVLCLWPVLALVEVLLVWAPMLLGGLLAGILAGPAPVAPSLPKAREKSS
jgi:hypothetical protein